MKRFIFAFAAALLALVSCEKDETLLEESGAAITIHFEKK